MNVITEEDFNKEREKYFDKKSKEDEEIIPRDKIPDYVTQYMLEQTAKVCFDEKLLQREYEIQNQFISDLSQKIGTKAFNCGSAYEGVKINAPDEFDHLFEIQGTDLNSSNIEFEEFELPTSKPTKYKDIKHRSYFHLKVKHLQGKDETLNNLLFRCSKCLNKDICQHRYIGMNLSVGTKYLCPKHVLGECYSKIINRNCYGSEPPLRCKDCLFEDSCSHSDKYLSPADQLKMLYKSAKASLWSRVLCYLIFDNRCPHMADVCDWAQQQHSWIHKHWLQLSVEYRWEPYLRCKECLGRNKCRYSCESTYLCPRAVQNKFFELIQDSVEKSSDKSSKPYISRNGPAITVYRKSKSGSHLVSTDLVPGIPIRNTNNRQWPLAGVLPIDLNEYITEYMEAHGEKTIKKCHFIPYGDFWKLTFVYCERDVTERVMQDPFIKLSYLALKSMRGVTSEAAPFENSILPSYILKVPFLREVLTDNSSGNHEPTEDVKTDLDLLFNGKCSPGSAAFHRILHLKETEDSMRKAFEVVERVEREGTAGRLTGLFIKNNLLRQPDDKAFQVVRRIKHHLQDFAKQTCRPADVSEIIQAFRHHANIS